MGILLSGLLGFLRAALLIRTRLALENAALRQQLTIYQRNQKHRKLRIGDRVFDELMSAWLPTYAALIKVPIIANPRFDGVRDTATDYQLEIDQVIESLLKEFRVDCVRLPAWSRDACLPLLSSGLREAYTRAALDDAWR